MRESIQGTEIKGITLSTVWQIAMMLRIRPHEVEEYIKNDELQSQMIDKSTMISEANLEAFLKTHSFPARHYRWRWIIETYKAMLSQEAAHAYIY